MLNWDTFSKVTEAEWKSKVESDLKGKKSVADFVYDVEGDYYVDPFVISVAKQNPISAIALPKSCIHIQSLDASKSNAQAKKFLNYGVSALIFTITDATDFSVLFNEIYIEMIDVFLLIEGNKNIVKTSWEKYKLDNPTAGSIVLVDNEAIKLNVEHSFNNRLKLFKSFSSTHNKDEKTVIIMEMKNDFLAQIAELKAIRSIWQNNDLQPEDLIIISTLPEFISDQNEVHPLIIANYLMMSAYLGMANFVCGFNDNNAELARLCMNIHHIFKEENLLTKVSDPTNGSYIIDALTAQMVDTIL